MHGRCQVAGGIAEANAGRNRGDLSGGGHRGNIIFGVIEYPKLLLGERR